MMGPHEPWSNDRVLNDRPNERGVALVVVLWVIVVLSIQVGLFTVQVRDGVRLLDNATAAARGQALMHAAVETAVARLTARVPRERWQADGAQRALRIGDMDVTLSIHDENARININAAEPALLEGLLRELTRSPGEAQMLADRIVDWRDPDSNRRTKGAEDQDYRRARMEHGAADQPFLDVADLGRVLGMSAELAQELAPHLTIYTADGRINPRLASETVLRSLPDVPRQTVDEAMQLIRRGGEAALGVDALLASARQYLSNARGPAFRIRVQSTGDRRLASGGGEAIVVLGLDAATPYRTLAWRFRPGSGDSRSGMRQ